MTPDDKQPPGAVPAPPELTETEKLQSAVKLLREKQIAECEAELNAVLAKHRCKIETVQIVRNGMPGKVQIVVAPLNE